MPKKSANTDIDWAPVREERPLHAPAFDAPVASTQEPDVTPQTAADTDPEEK